MAENIHPGSVVGDSIEEFKKLPTWGKVVAGILFLAVAYIGYSQYKSGQSSSIGAASPSVDTTGAGAGGGAGIQTVPGGSTGQVPLLPGGYNPIYDPNGNLVGFQPSPPPPPPTTSGTTSGTGNGSLLGGNPPVGGTVTTPLPLWQQLHIPGPLIPLGQYKGPSYSNLKPGTKYTYGGTTYTLTTSVKGEPGSGILYGTNPQGQTVALYGPPSAYHSVASPAVTQPGGKNGATQVPSSRIQ